MRRGAICKRAGSRWILFRILAAPDLAVTAGHCVYNDELKNFCDKYFLVFDYYIIDEHLARTRFEGSQVVECKGIVAREYGDWPADSAGDFTVLQLKNAITDRMPLPINRSKTDNSAKFAMMGYPSNLPLKFVLNASFIQDINDIYFTANPDTFHGNSGGPIVNLKTRQVEGIIVRLLPNVVILGSDYDYGYDNDNKCYSTYICKKSEGCDGGIAVTRASHFASALPKS